MRQVRRLVLAGLMSGTVAACGGLPTTPVFLDLTGTWNITKFEMVSQADPTLKRDELALNPGATASVVLGADLTVTFTSNVPGQGVQVRSGTYSQTVTSVTIIFTNPTESNVFTATLVGSTLSLTGANDSADFGSGSKPAYLNITATKQ